jgi:hypothetical protein
MKDKTPIYFKSDVHLHFYKTVPYTEQLPYILSNYQRMNRLNSLELSSQIIFLSNQ